jgi:hypothetical protein
MMASAPIRKRELRTRLRRRLNGLIAPNYSVYGFNARVDASYTNSTAPPVSCKYPKTEPQLSYALHFGAMLSRRFRHPRKIRCHAF